MSVNKNHPTEVIKYCPRCGSHSFEIVTERSFLCGDCGFNLYVNSAAAVACLIFNAGGELLLTRRAIEPHKGTLDLPGGFVDPGERAEDAVRRELKEELGLEVLRMSYLDSRPNEYTFGGITVFTTDLAFMIEPESLQNIAAADDISSFIWMRPNDVKDTDIPAGSIRYFVKNLAAHILAHERDKESDFRPV